MPIFSLDNNCAGKQFDSSRKTSLEQRAESDLALYKRIMATYQVEI